jgi:hypothetical protein
VDVELDVITDLRRSFVGVIFLSSTIFVFVIIALSMQISEQVDHHSRMTGHYIIPDIHHRHSRLHAMSRLFTPNGLTLVIPAVFKRESRGRRAGFRPKARRNDGRGRTGKR